MTARAWAVMVILLVTVATVAALWGITRVPAEMERRYNARPLTVEQLAGPTAEDEGYVVGGCGISTY